MKTTEKNSTDKLLNRETLAELFKDGMKPSGAIFSNLIYSMINKLDDGIEKNFDHGLSLSPQGNTAENLLSLFHQIDDGYAAWSLGLTSKEDGAGLNFKEGDNSISRLYIKKGGGIGINTTTPKHALDIKGDLGIQSRKGTYANGTIMANGKWQTILTNQTDCKLLEVSACAKGGKGEGKYAVLHAFALNPFSGKRGRIRKFQSYYGWRWWRRIQLRWVGTSFNYSLEMRTVVNYGEKGTIDFHITQLI
ncbi:hypothetical protein [Flavivirga jejuensis]|uniref:Adhesin n=1 Tax=Flavivirga jejuensis TaxID=870487 RepID=A0ABT8WP38_9FLAO|nr:hypothetical protein [Flavivirga jejuensis]MDO5974926.1 hypothetical protein [Flavivirga jejuensis]